MLRRHPNRLVGSLRSGPRQSQPLTRFRPLLSFWMEPQLKHPMATVGSHSTPATTSFADCDGIFKTCSVPTPSITFPPSTELPCREIQKMTASRPSTAPRSWRQRVEREYSSRKVYWIVHFESAVSAHDRGAQGRDRVAAQVPNGVWRSPLFQTGKLALNNAVRLRGHVGMPSK